MTTPVSFREALAVGGRIGFLSFGGPARQIALMHRIIVDEKRWLDENRFLHALNYCMVLPGPEAQQLATYIGWLMHGVRGGIIAGSLFILPGSVAILALSWLYVLMGGLLVLEGLFFGLKAAVLAIVVQALLRIAHRTLHGMLKPFLAVSGFVALFAFAVPLPAVVLGAAVIGYLARRRIQLSTTPGARQGDMELVVRPGTRQAALTCLLMWAVTVGGLYSAYGAENVFSQIAAFFSMMAVVTFGGAYAVLAYVAQQGVENYQTWKSYAATGLFPRLSRP